jgi:hypothetical protein
VWSTGNKVVIDNMQAVNTGDTFSLTVQMSTTSSAATLTPTVSIYTYVSGGSIVDQVVSKPFSPASLTNTNLQTLTSLDMTQAYVFSTPITAGYFGNLIMNYQPNTGSYSTIKTLTITLTSQFYPYSNQVGLPLSCKFNSVRYLCTYTLAPFAITINNLVGQISSSNNVVNITTNYLAVDGINFPSAQGRYLLTTQAYNSAASLL